LLAKKILCDIVILMLNYFFLYGTLMKGQKRFNYPALVPLRESISNASVRGAELYDFGDYPGMVLSGNNESIVYGEVHEFNSIEKAIKILDRLERFNPLDVKNSLFRREEIAVTLENGKNIKAWAYIFNQSIKGARRINSGDWRKR